MKIRTDSADNEKVHDNAKAMRRMLLKIGCETRCRVTYDLVAEFFGVKTAEELLALAGREEK